jgi:hypothetical protein
MRRASAYVVGIVLLALVGLAIGWFFAGGGPAPSSAPSPASRGAVPGSTAASLAVHLLGALLAGFLGGLLASWLGQRGTSGRSASVDDRLLKLGKGLDGVDNRLAAIERGLRSGAERDDKVDRILSRVADRPPPSPGAADWLETAMPDRARQGGPVQPITSATAPVRPAAAPSAPPRETVEEITARFGRVAAGQIARSGFSRFFSDLGPSGGVRVERGGAVIEAASGGEELLTAVNTSAGILVFPSYQFVSNQPTQFATIASVPDEVASIFDLTLGSGDLVVNRPAMFEEIDGETRRVAKGALGGFAG